MKLIIEKVANGIVPCGPGNGTQALGVYFKEVEGEFDYQPDEVTKELNNQEYLIGHGLLTDMVNAIKDAGFSKQYFDYLGAQTGTWLYCIGEEVANPEYRKYTMPMFELLSKAALGFQKQLIERELGDNEDLKSQYMKRLRAPLTAFVGEPKYYTGKADFYQQFNTVLAKVVLEEEAEFNPMAMVEIGNHNFATMIMKVDAENFEQQQKVLEEKYVSKDAITLPPQQVFVVDTSGAANSKASNFCMETGYRLNVLHQDENFLEF